MTMTTTAVAMGGMMPKDGKPNFVTGGGGGVGTVEHFVSSPPRPLSANIIHRRDVAWKLYNPMRIHAF
jgi:hypothetical protein